MDSTVAACIDLTSASSIAGKTIDDLSVENKEAFHSTIHKNLKKSINKNVKDLVLGVAHSKALEDINKVMAHCCVGYMFVDAMNV